jgi:hypothetical protein
MKYLILLLLPVFALAKETTIQERDGSTTRIETTRQGTEVFVNEKSVYSAGGDRHQEQIDYSLNQGGKVVDQKN